jgi:uncharacterized UBP type Zn finger protein
MLFYLFKVSATIVLVGLFFYILTNWKLHCPKCRKPFAAKVTDKKVISDKKVQEIAWNEKKGIDEERTISYQTVKYEYTCKNCQHKWKVTRQEG